MKLPKNLREALRGRYGSKADQVIKRVEAEAATEMRPAIELLRERMHVVDMLQEVLTEEVLEAEGGLEAINQSYAPGATATTPGALERMSRVQRRALEVRGMDQLVQTLATVIAPYETPKLSANANLNAEVDLGTLSDEELEERYQLELKAEAMRLVQAERLKMTQGVVGEDE